MDAYQLDDSEIMIIIDATRSEAVVLVNLNKFLTQERNVLKNYSLLEVDCHLTKPLKFKPKQKTVIRIRKENFDKNIRTSWNISFPKNKFRNENAIKNNISITLTKIKEE